MFNETEMLQDLQSKKAVITSIKLIVKFKGRTQSVFTTASQSIHSSAFSLSLKSKIIKTHIKNVYNCDFKQINQ